MEGEMILNFEEDVIMPEGYEEGDDIFEQAMDEEQALTMEQEPGQRNVDTEPAEDSVVPQTEEPTTAPEVKEETPKQTVRIKFNHEERDIDLNEAATLAQKGLAFDKAKARADQAEQSLAQMAAEAKALGYESVQDMLAAARKSYDDNRVQSLINEGNTEAMARFLVNQEAKERAAAVVIPQEPVVEPTQEPTVQKAPSAFKDGEIEEFVQMYPGVTKIPQEVIDSHQKGVRLSVAYERYQSKQAQEELRVLRQNQAAAARAPISSGVTEGGGGNTKPPEKDPFLEGFDSDNW